MSTDESGRSALHRAAAEGKTALVTELLEAAEDPNARDAYSQTPLILAAERGHLGTVVCLAQHPSTEVAIKDSFGRLPLHWASQRCDVQMVQALLDRTKSCVNARTTGGDTPLMWCVASSLATATSLQKCLVAKLLLTSGADLTLTNETGESAFTLASSADSQQGSSSSADSALVKFLQMELERLQAEEAKREEEEEKASAAFAVAVTSVTERAEQKGSATGNGSSGGSSSSAGSGGGGSSSSSSGGSSSGGAAAAAKGFLATKGAAKGGMSAMGAAGVGVSKKKLKITLKK